MAKKMLFGAISNDRVANAYLFLGHDAATLEGAALAFAAALNCSGAKGAVCGQCPSCRKMAKEVHPDVVVVRPQGSSIRIDQIRELISYTRFGPSEGRYKVCVLSGADSMTTEAANSFLKTLEEPHGDIVFLLLAPNDVGIPRTITSRCQRILFAEGAEVEAPLETDSAWMFDRINSVSPRDTAGALEVSQEIFERSDDIEDGLESLVRMFWLKGRGTAMWRKIPVVMGALSALKKRANARLALDCMCLRIGEINDD